MNSTLGSVVPLAMFLRHACSILNLLKFAIVCVEKSSVISFYHLHIIIAIVCLKYFCAGYQHEGGGIKQEVIVVSKGEDQV